MLINIIHLNERKDRFQTLINELAGQKAEYVIWEGVKDLEKPWRGIAKAHKQIVAWARQEKLSSVIIAEDDVKFTANGAFDYFLKNEPIEYDLYLGGIYYGDIKHDNSVEDFSGAHLYMINNRFYDTFLSITEEMDFDRALQGKGKFIVCNPFVAIQHNGFSDNKNQFRNYDVYLQNRKLFREQ